jgi:hypothetical protein
MMNSFRMTEESRHYHSEHRDPLKHAVEYDHHASVLA